MQIIGDWLAGLDGVVRPVILLRVRSADGQLHREAFLIDTGADRTILRRSAHR
jgi:hypothetical protein